MKAICPKNPKHKRFITTAHVAEDWVVDEHGEFIKSLGATDTLAKPNPYNTWTCKTCGADAVIQDRHQD